jgi:hypothetical protein
MKQLDQFFDDLAKSLPIERELVWLNMLPVNIYKIHFTPDKARLQSSSRSNIKRGAR